jgi:hypothetical protein
MKQKQKGLINKEQLFRQKESRRLTADLQRVKGAAWNSLTV